MKDNDELTTGDRKRRSLLFFERDISNHLFAIFTSKRTFKQDLSASPYSCLFIFSPVGGKGGAQKKQLVPTIERGAKNQGHISCTAPYL